MLPESAALLTYLALGPFTWAGFAVCVYQTRKRMNLLKKQRAPIRGQPPSVTILVPAKDEAHGIRACIESALAQQYPNFNVIAIDDRSNDDTGKILDDLAAAHPRLKVIHIPKEPLPDGWTGKCHALHQGAKQADGQWLLFYDADVTLEPNALTATMAVALERELGLLTLIPRLATHGIWERLIVPLAGAAHASVFLAPLGNDSLKPNIAYGNGQFMLFRRDAYDKSGGHEAVKSQFCEDMALARRCKQLGLRPRVSWGAEVCAVRMYDSLDKMFRGWSRIFFASAFGSAWPSLIVLFFIFACCFSAYAAFAWGVFRALHPITSPPNLYWLGWCWLGGAVLHWLLMTVQISFMYRWTANPRRYALALPLSLALLTLILFKALRLCAAGRVEWRGTRYSHAIESKSKMSQSTFSQGAA